MVLLDALYINNSGGRILLNEMILQLHDSGKHVFYLLDKRVRGSYDFLPHENVMYLENSLIKRHKFYLKRGTEFSTVLCFGNIPPSIRLKAKVYTYFHNTIYFYTSNAFSPRVKWMSRIKALVIRTFKNNTDKWWVQTDEVTKLFGKFWGIPSNKIEVLPFFLSKTVENISEKDREKNSFLFISDGHPNKMHLQLLEAMQEVYLTYPDTKLYLTISAQYPALLAKIEELKNNGLGVENLGWCDEEALDKLYRKCGFFIFPSNQESFGLGLIEASQYEMKILASDLPFTHAVISPSLVFQPEDKTEIAKAMVRARETELTKARLLISSQINQILKKLI
ncbi:glycosyltransferase [Rhodonellum sp.]|uniref:glycosyltransferase n=1 Tax=Rhodonellum sp. TaxID=2231180 RepID=UPI002721E899|nr:glycosyltransferase [Rhodonellum sp.]MDO9551467.1 glycosyltransferase [Rhodonellum sp.]